VKTIVLNRPLQSWNERIELTLEKIELRADHRMRWFVSVWNKSGKKDRIRISGQVSGADVYVTDQAGKKCSYIRSSMGDFIELPIGENLRFWLDFEGPLAGATALTAHFTTGDTKTLPQIVVRLPGR
jgi:hypothetical protein